ncbi:MAG TPA: 5,10-methylenetetrahydrofolate reductase [Candidatus Margulisbacteria bacterium]|nr:5,10-methylenetetrahydrofolate reductase [Candidatus Margulisiibacteriota bacterium]
MLYKSRLHQDLLTKKFVVTAELSPPKGVEYNYLLDQAEALSTYVSAFNITDNQRSTMRMSALAICHLLESQGFETIFQITCRDRNILALQSDILGASALGIKNILAITGDYPLSGDHPFAKPVFDIDSVQLVHLLKQVMPGGKDFAGKELKGSPDFIVGVVANHGAQPQEPQLIKLQKKINEGAEFIQTQTIYDIDQFLEFLEEVPPAVPVLGGIFPLKSAKIAHFLNDNVPGVSIPETILRRMENTKDPYKEGIEIAVETIEAIQPECAGVHFMTMGAVDVIAEILKEVSIDK